MVALCAAWWSTACSSPGVCISPGAVVKNSVVMKRHPDRTRRVAYKVVVDKQVTIGAGAVVGIGDESVKNEQMPDRLFAGITVIGRTLQSHCSNRPG